MIHPRMHRPMLALCFGLLLTGAPGGEVRSQVAAPLAENMVFVTEDRAVDVPGCDAITVFGLQGPAHKVGQVLFRSAFQVSPGRLAGSDGFRVVTALSSNSSPKLPFLKILKQTMPDPPTWEESSVSSERLVLLAGHAVLADDDTVLLPTQDLAPDPLNPRYSLEKYRLSEISSDQLGPPRGALPLDGPPIRVFVADSGRTIHVPTTTGTVYSADVATMSEIAPRIPIMPISVSKPVDATARLARAHATLSADERYLATNTWETGGIAVADLQSRTARAMVLRPGKIVAGVEFSRRGYTRGLLAANLLDRVAIFTLEDGARVREVARQEISPITHDLCFTYHTEICSGPYASIAWGGDGSYLIAASRQGESEFAVLNVQETRLTLSSATWLTACDDPTANDFPNDILTANRTTPPGMNPEPTSTPEPSAISSPTSIPTPLPTSTTTASPTQTPTIPPTATPTLRFSAYLPFTQSQPTPPDDININLAPPQHPVRVLRAFRVHP